MATRLERLISLLDVGSTPVVRATAAQQIGDIQRQHPEDLYNLLARVLVHLRSSSWETRVAASQAIHAIARNVPSWEPPEVIQPQTNTTSDDDSYDDFLKFETVDLDIVIRNGATLVSSAGSEFDRDEEALGNMDPKERIALQKRQLMDKLGLGAGFMDVDLFDETDIGGRSAVRKGMNPKEMLQASVKAQPKDSLADVDTSTLSKRELLALKRKAKVEAKTGSKRKVTATDLVGSSSSANKKRSEINRNGPSHQVRVKGEDYDDNTDNNDGSKVIIAHKPPKEETDEDIATFSQVFSSGDEWPFEGVCEQLFLDVFDNAWEIRHGAAMALRDIIKISGAGAGMIIGVDKHQNQKRHLRWLEDASIRLLCVLALDKFADFVGELVVLPIVETVAQTLAALVQLCQPDLAIKIVERGLIVLADGSTSVPADGKALSSDYEMKKWQVRHAGLIGLKYLMAVRQDLVGDLLIDKSTNSQSRVFRAILKGLRDQEDDVRAVSSSTLLPIATTLFQLLPPAIIYQNIVLSLWDSLTHLDDIAAATAPIMALLARLLSENAVMDVMQESTTTNLSVVTPRLYPFFRHNIASVRIAVLNTLSTLAQTPEKGVGRGDASWISIDLMRLVFQNFVLETHSEVVELSYGVWRQLIVCLKNHHLLVKILMPLVPTLLSIAMSPIGTAYDLRLLLLPKEDMNRQRPGIVSDQDKAIAMQDLTVARYSDILYGKIKALKALGNVIDALACDVPESHLLLQEHLPAYASSGMAAHRIYTCIMVEEWASLYHSRQATRVGESTIPVASNLHQILSQHLAVADSGQQVLYTEVMTLLEGVWSACASIGAGSRLLPPLPPLPNRPPLATPSPLGPIFTTLVAAQYLEQASRQPLNPAQMAALAPRLANAKQLIEACQSQTSVIDTRVLACAAAAVLVVSALPSKVNPIVRSLMSSVKTEAEELLQQQSGCAVANLISSCLGNSKSANVADRVLKNLLLMVAVGLDVGLLSQVDEIISLMVLESQAAVADSKKKIKKKNADMPIDGVTSNIVNDATVESLGDTAESLSRRGAEYGLRAMCNVFGANLFDALPRIWDTMAQPFATANTSIDAIARLGNDEEYAKDVFRAIRTMGVLIPYIHSELRGRLSTLLPSIVQTLRSPLAKVRHAAATCLSAVASVMPPVAMRTVVDGVLPLFGEAQHVSSRQGAVECVFFLIDKLEINLLPYITFLIVPTLGRMSDQDAGVRHLASQSFAQLVRLIPLEAGVPDPEGFPQDMILQRNQERRFVAQLVGAEKVEEYQFPDGLVIKADLRPYQREGVSWLAFLSRFGLHGILCDDMGLGKTLQTICAIASEHFTRRQRYSKTGLPADAHLSSLVVCPPTLTAHWFYEIQQFADSLKPILYVGSSSERARLRGQLQQHDIVITSYEVLRNDIEDLSSIWWNYCVLDEGHIIRNSKAKLTQAVKRVRAQHRLILSGTPIQNRVLELWSLFDFLMPGFLGSERRFNEVFSKPIQSSRDAKSTSREQEAGALALASLHRQVLPFLLRRMKEDVLHDLPPKIIQDYYCELSPIQKMLYEEFSGTQARVDAESDLTDDATKTGSKGQHVFQALQYLRKLCDHPALVLSPEHPKYNLVMSKLQQEGSQLREVKHAPKLESLRQILLECGIGASSPTTESNAASNDTEAVAPHRALIFCQLKAMLDLIEEDVLRKLMPTVTYLRMDGSVEASKRHEIVTRFNKDPSIDLLLLTTHVGGLGLNLTGADTVIFVEHDWNPMKDLQAMDRAHRIGQKRVVNVYRLITRGTLEEKIMGLQKFKLNIASSVVNEENVGIRSIGEGEQVLDLFKVDSGDGGSGAGGKGKGTTTSKEVLENLQELWKESDYDDLDVGSFLKGLK
ncbi:hypothetical protein SmJEL517_g03103 [Synchytrium microbalum]|uniref:TATA-binding protein-associated factor n=1 Tax=Synchytrium microbalum TaxID=1806994 RepID=A0A507C3G1_9FUNG|nr:uncharacterized protein SmJEL517_g03103 [Synchytrium microbalum]TPX34202.1 hypothetical protein SmJEL517_g03103 [Synchytrium microbalum]